MMQVVSAGSTLESGWKVVERVLESGWQVVGIQF